MKTTSKINRFFSGLFKGRKKAAKANVITPKDNEVIVKGKEKKGADGLRRLSIQQSNRMKITANKKRDKKNRVQKESRKINRKKK